MANPEQLEYLQDTAEDWNIYRREHSIMHPDLSGADLSASESDQRNPSSSRPDRSQPG